MIVVGDVLIERDAATGASYYVLDEVDVAQTVEVDELVSVDLAADGHPVGVEFAFSRVPTHDDWLPVLNAISRPGATTSESVTQTPGPSPLLIP